MVPSPESTPLPHKTNTTEERAKYCSVYLRPWVLLRRDASQHVPFLADLDIVPKAPQEPPRKRQRLSTKVPDPDAQIRNFHKAWAHYIRGNVVSNHASRLVTNFLLAVLAEGRHHDKVDEVDEAAPPDMKVELAELSLARVHQLVNTQIRKDAQKVEKDERETGSRRLLKAMEVTASFWQLPEGRNKVQITAQQHCMTKKTEEAQLGTGGEGSEAEEGRCNALQRTLAGTVPTMAR